MTIREKLVNSLSQIKNNAIGSIETITSVKLAGGKKNPLQDRVSKVSSGGSVIMFGNCKSNGYANMKTKQMKKAGIVCGVDGKYIPKKRVWGNRINNTPLVYHKDKVYAEVIYLHKPKVEYYIDGNVKIDKADIQGLPKSRKSSNSDVILRTINLDNITRLKMGKLSVS